MTGIYYYGSTYIASVYPLPKIKQIGNSILYNSTQENEDTLRIINWIGMTNYNFFGTDYDYPFATAGQHDAKGNKVANFSLFLNGPEGIIETFHRRWEDWQSYLERVKIMGNPNITIKELLDLIEIVSSPQDVSPENQKRWVLINNIKYLPRKIDVEISPQGIETVKFELIKKAYG